MSAKRSNLSALSIATPARTEVQPEEERRFLGLQEVTESQHQDAAESQGRRRWKDSRLRRDITGTERLQVYVPPPVAERLRLCGVKERRSQSDIVTAALESYLAAKL